MKRKRAISEVTQYILHFVISLLFLILKWFVIPFLNEETTFKHVETVKRLKPRLGTQIRARKMMNKNHSFRRKVHLLPPFILLSLSLSFTLSLFHQIPLAPSKRILITTSHSCGSEYYTSYVVSQETCERKFFQKKPEGLFEREFSFSLLSLPFFKHSKLFWKSVKKVIYHFFRSKIYFQ